jgi:GNAT superfamily N-acetyltransferase
MWRPATADDDEAIVRLCAALNAEDPGPKPVPREHVARTLRLMREAPWRVRALVLELDAAVRGYALLCPYWSNEMGGEVCVIDELYVEPAARGRGHAGALIEHLAARAEPWLAGVVALALETTPDNAPARRLYERHGFVGRNLGMRRLLK